MGRTSNLIAEMGFYHGQQQGFYYQQQPKGFYYNQQPEGFYYQQQPQGFYYNQQQGFYYDQADPKKAPAKKAAPKNFSKAWKENKNAVAVSEKAKKHAQAKVAAIMIANNHRPGPTENRVLSQIAAERLAYEAGEIFMNSQSPDDNMSADDIRKELFKLATKAIDGRV